MESFELKDSLFKSVQKSGDQSISDVSETESQTNKNETQMLSIH